MTALTTRPSPPARLGLRDLSGFQRLAGASLIIASLLMVAGAIAWSTTGVDTDTALEQGASAALLVDMAAHGGALTLGFSLWLAATPFFAIAGVSLGRTYADRPAGVAAGGLMAVGSAIAAVAFMGFLTMTVAMAPAHATISPEFATAINFFVSRADWVATIAIVGLPPALLSRANRDEWPTWLTRMGSLGIVTSLLTVLAMVLNTGLATFGFAIVPVGVLWSIAAGVHMVRTADDESPHAGNHTGRI